MTPGGPDSASITIDSGGGGRAAMADEIRALALTGMLGAGFHESRLARALALAWEPDFIGPGKAHERCLG